MTPVQTVLLDEILSFAAAAPPKRTESAQTILRLPVVYYAAPNPMDWI